MEEKNANFYQKDWGAPEHLGGPSENCPPTINARSTSIFRNTPSLNRRHCLRFPSRPTSIKNLKAKSTFQTELLEAPLPRIATLRALRKSDGPIAYKLQINAQEAKLVKPIELKLRFDIDQMEQNIHKKYTLVPGMEGFQKALKREVQWLSFYK